MKETWIGQAEQELRRILAEVMEENKLLKKELMKIKKEESNVYSTKKEFFGAPLY